MAMNMTLKTLLPWVEQLYHPSLTAAAPRGAQVAQGPYAFAVALIETQADPAESGAPRSRFCDGRSQIIRQQHAEIIRLACELDRALRERDAARREPDLPFLNETLPYFYLNKIPEASPHPDWSKETFLRLLPPECRLLDVGCGNNSPFTTKAALPNCYYVGIDIGETDQLKPEKADEYVLTSSERFCDAIGHFEDSFDAVISAHNLEHCEDRIGVIRAMARALKKGGRAFISFPCAESVDFPSRDGTLNYYDDPTHRLRPPDFTEVVAELAKSGLRVLYATTRAQAPIRWMIGVRHEVDSDHEAVVKGETWAFWGFETIIWAERRADGD